MISAPSETDVLRRMLSTPRRSKRAKPGLPKRPAKK